MLLAINKIKILKMNFLKIKNKLPNRKSDIYFSLVKKNLK